MSNVIEICGSGTKVIHLNVVTSTTKQELAAYSSRISTNSNNYSALSPTNHLSPRSTARLPQSPPTRNVTNRDIFSNDDNGEVKTVYFNSDPNVSREQLLLPTDTYIKEELVEYDDFEEYESMDEDEVDESNSAKAQYKCSGCDKAFCYEGWLDRHKQTSPACSNAHSIRTTIDKEQPSGGSSGSRDRQSLEGRLSELLRCPNDKCDFTTHWLQSLNKHVFHSCKFRKPTTSAKKMPINSSPKRPSVQVCHLCGKGLDGSEQHIEHMKNVHQIKLLYQCSACKQNFATKQESEAHIDKYHSSGKETTDDGLSNGAQPCWRCELCNKSYLSLRSYEIHRTSCAKGVEQPVRKLAQRSATVSSPPKKILPISNSVTHFRREQIEAIHKNDYKCKLCRKLFVNSFGLCNHLSRRPVCREWYYTNLPNELKKKNSLHLMPKFNNTANHSPKSNNNQISHNSTASSSSSNKVTNKAPRDKDIAVGANHSTAKCKRCNKIFIGKNPTVALANHLRGSNCVVNNNKPEYVKSRILKAAQSGPSRVQSYGDNRYYCKLCNSKESEVEVKNRVSLGCHLTIYHGLPQVNVDTGSGDGFRCQTCSQVFESKYFYNLHRQDCDLTSPYVGMITDDEIIQRKNQYMKGETCEQCGRTGFSTTTAVSIHQKYQCVKRSVNPKSQPSLRQRFQNSQTVATRQPKPVVRQPVPREKSIPQSEMARLNHQAKTDPRVTMCDSCGRGPYNSYYYFMEHKKKYCNALKGDNNAQQAKAKKSVQKAKRNGSNKPKETICLFPTVPRARKTFTYANVSSPQISQDSISSTDEDMKQEEGSIDLVEEVIKCGVCPEEFDDTLAFIRHRLGHITEELIINEEVQPIDCELCGARVHHYQRIQQHLILHLQNVQIMKKKNLVEVQKKNLDLRAIVSQSDDDDNDGSHLRCPYCNAQYLARDELAEHIKNTCPYRYHCPFCSNTYSAKESYLQHKEICSKASTSNAMASKAPTYKCRNCGLEFKVKQQLLCHEHACNKVYTADYSGRVEQLIERTLTCSVCGLVSDVYERKVKHESQCLKRYLAVIGNTTEEIQSTGEETDQPIVPMDFNLTSLSNTSESSDVPEEVINNLKEEFGIKKDLKVLLTGFDEEIVRKVKNDLYCEKDESSQFEALKESFKTLVSRLTKNDARLLEMSQESRAEVLLQRMLHYLGEQPIQHNGLNQLNCFRQNLQLFLKLTIRDDTLVMAYKDAESVDEAIVNMLNFECEFNS